ncbi:MAG: transcriptional repressor [Gorillibacterium sp.]|nr:transcriptional repressor [Gorillibacterium sp.]
MESRFEQALDKLKMTGVRMTPQRHAILSYLLETVAHPSADDIYKALVPRFPSMSVATVYNNLRVFIESGLVRELNYGDASSRFDADVSNHFHSTCKGCGKIVDFNYPALSQVEEAASLQTGFMIEGLRLEVSGWCPECKPTIKH